MIIEIRSHGGFAGLSAAAAPAHRIDTKDQPRPVREALCDAFQPDRLSRLADQPCPGRPDRMHYAITIQTGADRHSITLSEAQLPPEMLDLIDRL